DDVVVTETRGLQNSTVEAQLTLSLSSQPGIRPIDVGAWEFEEILDDRGKSLRNEGKIKVFRGGRPESDPEVGDSLDSVWFTLDRHGRFAGRFGAPLPITPPSPEARRIARLKAKVKVTFALQDITRVVKVQDMRDKGGDAAPFGRAAIRFSSPELKDNSFRLHYV